VVVTALGDLLGAKGVIVNFVLRHVKKMVPRFEIAGAVRFNRMLDDGKGLELKRVAVGQEETRVLPVHRGHDRSVQGRGALAPEHSRQLEQSVAWLRPWIKEEEPQAIITALPLYHIMSLTANCLLMMKSGRLQYPHHQPARYSRPGDGDAQAQVHHVYRVNTLFNALMNHPDFTKIDSPTCRSLWAGAWRFRRRWPIAGRK